MIREDDLTSYRKGWKIEHSGQTFVCQGFKKGGNPVWEPDEFIARFKFSETQAQCIRNANPHGIEEGGLYADIGGLPDDFSWKKYGREY